jgi:hypothetical protein
LNSFFQHIGITHKVSCPHAHQQNGVVERKHLHIVEVSLALLANASMPLKYWDQAFLTATHLINFFLARSLGMILLLLRMLEHNFGRIYYISRDVIFDENVYPFAQLHPNAGAQLRKELIVLPFHLLKLGDVNCTASNITNAPNNNGDGSD